MCLSVAQLEATDRHIVMTIPHMVLTGPLTDSDDNISHGSNWATDRHIVMTIPHMVLTGPLTDT
jgi:hypothetical protein